MDMQNEIGIIEQMLTFLNDGHGVTIPDSGINDTARRIKDFIDKLPGGFLIYNADGKEEIIYANKALIRMFGCDTFKEFIALTNNSFKGLVYSEDVEAVENSIKQQIKHHDDLDYVEYRIQRKDGSLRWVEDYGHYVQTRTMGNIFYVFITDATEKINKKNLERTAFITENQEKEKRLLNLIEEYDKERKLIRQEHLQRLEVIEGLSVDYDTILYADLDSDKVIPYRLSNRVKGYFVPELSNHGFSWFSSDYVNNWVFEDDRESVAEEFTADGIRKRLAENRTYHLNFRCRKKGEPEYLQVRIVNVGSGEHISQIVIGGRNIDNEILLQMEQKAILEEALNNAKLASIAKNTFLSNMSHDMRTPLNAIFGYTALAKKNLRDRNSVEEFLDKIDNAGRQILGLVDKVLEISYIESKDFKISEKPCDVCRIAEDVYNSIKPDAVKKNINVEFECSTVENKLVFADEDKLRQILSHIAGNAVKYTGDSGNIKLIISEHRSHSNEFATFRFTMKDTGVGIDKDALNRIFEPFEREKNYTNSGIFGSGLGLTIAKRIIEMMGGSIEAESQIGKGSSFTVTLSLKLQNPSPASSSGAKRDIYKEIKGKKILLVEDNEINLEIETEMLEDIGFVIEPAENGQIAVDKVSASKPDEYLFVLMDIQMPVMDGRQATEAIRKLGNKKLADIPIIALSANAFESDRRMSIDRGMDAHLTKPIDIPALLQTVENVVFGKEN